LIDLFFLEPRQCRCIARGCGAPRHPGFTRLNGRAGRLVDYIRSTTSLRLQIDEDVILSPPAMPGKGSLRDLEARDSEAGFSGYGVDQVDVVSIHENVGIAQLVDRVIH
jgi:hypothetical protein